MPGLGHHSQLPPEAQAQPPGLGSKEPDAPTPGAFLHEACLRLQEHCAFILVWKRGLPRTRDLGWVCAQLRVPQITSLQRGNHTEGAGGPGPTAGLQSTPLFRGEPLEPLTSLAASAVSPRPPPRD